MRLKTKNNRKNGRSTNRLLAQSAQLGLERMENRVLMSTTLAAWQFDTLPANTSVTAIQTSPATTSGTGTAYTVGMQSGTSNGYLYPATGADATLDASTYLAATGSADSGGNGGSEGGTAGFVWRVESGQDSAAPIGSQGVQFNVSTSGQSGIQIQWDMNPSSTKAEAQFYVEYTTDVQDANPVWTNVTGSLAFGPNDLANTQGTVPSIGTSPTDSVYIQDNTSNANIVTGDYATITGPIVAGSNTSWLDDLQVNLSGISAVNNASNFAFRVVNAATSTSETTVAGASGTAEAFKNWRFNDIVVTAGNVSLSGPSIVTDPSNQNVIAGQPVSFSASATGDPTPTVQWYEGTPGSGTAITNNPAATTNTLTFTTSSTASDDGTTYYAQYTNSQGTADTTAATLTDMVQSASPTITEQPASQTANAGSSVTLIAGATGSPAPTVQWMVSNNAGVTWTAVQNATSTFLTVPATEGITGNEYEAVFTNTSGVATTNPATITVLGTPVAEWDFATGQAATPGGSTAPGSGNSPLATTAINSGDSTSILGLVNQYDGLQSVPEADIIPLASSVDPSVEDYVWRVRGGGGEGPTGTPGSPDGWSQNAPEDTQGVEFNVNTTGFSNITLNFNWQVGGIGDLQPQYFNGNESEWVNIGTTVQGTASDYYGVSAPTTTAAAYTLTADTGTTINVASSSSFNFDENITVGGIAAVVTGVGNGQLTILPTASGSVASGATVTGTPDPTGVFVNLQNIAYADNNPDLQVRLVSVYDPALPQIVDGNNGLSNYPQAHGQYASGYGTANDIQVVDLDDFVNSGGANDNADGQNFTLTLGTQTTGEIEYSSDPTTMATNIETALDALSSVGANGVSVASTVALNNYTPPGPITAYQGYSVIFSGGLVRGQAEPTMTISDSNDNVSTWQQGTPNSITTTTTAPYTVTANESLTVSVGSTTNFTVGNPVLLGDITALITGMGANSLTLTPEGSGSVLTGTTVKQLGASGFVDGGGSWELADMNFQGDLISGAPSITANPAPATAAGGFPVTFSASAYSETLPTVQWQVSTDNGDTWSNVSGGTTTPTGGLFTQSSNDQYTSTYSFTVDSNLDQNNYEYRAAFTSSVGTTDSGGATLTAVAPVLPYVLIQPSNESVQEGQATFFTSYGAGNPAPTIQWEISTDNGLDWSNLSDGSTVNGSQTNVLTLVAQDNTSQNGDLVRAAFVASTGTTYSNTVTLSVLPTESVLTDWDFNAEYPQVSATGSADPLVINPAPVAAGVDNSLDVGGTATPLGMNLPYNPEDPASGNPPTGAVDDEDIVNSGPAVISTSFTENTWRIRGGTSANPADGGQPANGWSNFVAPDTQGAEFAVPTSGYEGIYVTLDWFSTHSGEQDAQRQYSLDGGNTWINLGPQIQLYAPGNDDFYGDSTLNGVVPVVFDLTGIAGASNNPNLAVRMVNSYNLVLSNQQTITLNDTSNFTLTFNNQTTPTIDYSPNSSTMLASIQNALNNLVGQEDVSVSYNSTNATYVVQFEGGLGTSIQPAMTINTTSGADTIAQKDQYANAQLNQNGDPFNPAPYNGAKGNWRLDNIVFHGTAVPPFLWTGAADGVNWNNAGNWFGDAVPTSTSNVIIPAGSVVDLPAGVSSAASLTLEGNATLDVGSGTLMIDYGTGTDPIASIASSLASGYNGGTWTGTGITDSAVAAENASQKQAIYDVGYADGADGIVTGLSAGEIEIMPTLAGDAKLQGNVQFGDFQTLAQYFGKVGGWDEGNFTYGATVDFGDFQQLAQDFGQTSAFGASESSGGVVAASQGVQAPASAFDGDSETADSAASVLGSDYLSGKVSGLVSFSSVPLDLA
jgi:Immunoglobulin I-set domain